MSASLRLRLAVWYAALLALILVATSIFSYSFHSISHYEDVDRSLVATAAHVLGQLRAGGGGHQVESGTDLSLPQEVASLDIFVRLYDAEGRLVALSPNAARHIDIDPREVAARPRSGVDESPFTRLMRSLVNLGQARAAEEGGFLTIAGPEGQGRTRVYAVPLDGEGATSGYLEVGDSLDRLDRSMDRLRLLLLGMSGVGLVAALVGGWAIAGSALHPVAAMADTARAIALSRGFSRRLPSLGRSDELGQLAATFNEMLSSLDEAYRAQQRFVADASHELRAPLTAIQGNLELLERAPRLSEEERAETLAHLRRETKRMNRLVADLLVLARADAGQSLKVEPVELDRLLLDVFREARVLARGRRVSLRELDQLQVEGDPDRLKQLLVILLDNALKYTPEGGDVRLALRAEAGVAAITVSDTGIGIDPDDLPHIFERFYRADKARGRDTGGSGLGLSIAKWIAERHGGQILVDSAPGQGSVFTVRLPISRRRPRL